MRRYEVEFLEWLGLGTYPNIPWKEYVMQKVIKYFNGLINILRTGVVHGVGDRGHCYSRDGVKFRLYIVQYGPL